MYNLKEYRKCSKCNDIKNINDFYKRNNCSSGKHYYCKSCHSKIIKDRKRTLSGKASNIYDHQVGSSVIRSHVPPTYTRKEFVQFAINSIEYVILYLDWVKSDYQKMKSPSFDRDNDNLPYSFDNFNKWMTWKENVDKFRKQRMRGETNKSIKPVTGIHIETNQIISFYSAAEAERQTGIHHANIAKVCKNKATHAGGYKWSYNLKNQ